MPIQSKRRSISAAVLLVAAIGVAAPSIRQTNVGGLSSKSVEVLWISRAWGPEYDSSQIVDRYPNLKRVYLPLFQFAPTRLAASTDKLSAYFQKEVRDYKLFKSHGIEVFGVFAPLEINDQTDGPPSLHELSLVQAFAPKPNPETLTILGEEAGKQYADWMDECLSSAEVDGVVIDIAQPIEKLFSYSSATREYFVKKYHFDPVDIDYPLGLVTGLKLTDQDLVDIIVKDRLEGISSLVGRISTVCKKHKKQTEAFSLATSYTYPATTRAASLSDWGRWLLENSDLRVVLGMSGIGESEVDSCVQARNLANGLKIDPARLTFLLRSGEPLSSLSSTGGFSFSAQTNSSRLAVLYTRLKS